MICAAFRSSRLYRVAFWLALWAMLLSSLVPLVHVPAAVAGHARLCHVALDNNAKKTSEQGKTKPSCPICRGIGQLAQGFLAPEITSVEFIQPEAMAIIADSQSVIVFAFASSAWPRAPPPLA